MFLVVGVSMINKLRLGVLGVAKITIYECVCMHVHAVCVAYLSVGVCFLVISELFLLLTLFLTFLYPQNYFRVTSHNPRVTLTSISPRISTAMTGLYTIYICLCCLSALVLLCLPDQY